MSHVSRLLLEVFKYLEPEELLSAALRVNRLWRNTALKEELWLTFLLKQTPSNMTFEQFPNLKYAYFCLFRRNRYQYVVSEIGEKCTLVKVDLKEKRRLSEVGVDCKCSVLLLKDENLFLCGGKYRKTGFQKELSATKTCFYHTQTGIFREISGLLEGKNDVCLVEKEGKVYAFGGWSWSVSSMRRRYVEHSTVDAWQKTSWNRSNCAVLPAKTAHVSAVDADADVMLCLSNLIYRFNTQSQSYTEVKIGLNLGLEKAIIGKIDENVVFFEWNDNQTACFSLTSLETVPVSGIFPKSFVGNFFPFQEGHYILTKCSNSLQFLQIQSGKEGLTVSEVRIA